MRALIAVIVLLPLLSGCARLQTYRVVDAQSGRPIEGLQVERLESSVRPSAMPFVLYDSLSPVEKQTTDAAGTVTFKEAGAKVMCNPSSKNATYGRAYVTSGWTGVKICYPDEYREISVKPVGGVVEIPLPNRRPGLRGPVSQDSKRDGLDEDFSVIGDRDITMRRAEVEAR